MTGGTVHSGHASHDEHCWLRSVGNGELSAVYGSQQCDCDYATGQNFSQLSFCPYHFPESCMRQALYFHLQIQKKKKKQTKNCLVHYYKVSK